MDSLFQSPVIANVRPFDCKLTNIVSPDGEKQTPANSEPEYLFSAIMYG